MSIIIIKFRQLEDQAVTDPHLTAPPHVPWIASINSRHLARNIPNAQLFICPDAGHGAHDQYPECFLKHAIQFPDE